MRLRPTNLPVLGLGMTQVNLSGWMTAVNNVSRSFPALPDISG
jgi:hypothetical protein